jgi:hypothetical protein
LAFKVFHESLGKRLMPGIEIKASPAKCSGQPIPDSGLSFSSATAGGSPSLN